MMEPDAQRLVAMLRQIKTAEQSFKTAPVGSSASILQATAAIDQVKHQLAQTLAGSSASAVQLAAAMDQIKLQLAGSSSSVMGVTTALDQIRNQLAHGTLFGSSAVSVARAAAAIDQLARNVDWRLLAEAAESRGQLANTEVGCGYQDSCAQVDDGVTEAQKMSGIMESGPSEPKSPIREMKPLEPSAPERLRPPTAGEKLMYLLLSKANREALLGDLEEEYCLVAVRLGARFARIWYWEQVFLSILPILQRRMITLLKLLSMAKVLEMIGRMSR